jgi:hypothetical protein
MTKIIIIIIIIIIISGSAAQRGLPCHTRFLDHTQRSATFGDQFVTETSTWQHTTHTTDKYPCPGEIRIHDRNR